RIGLTRIHREGLLDEHVLAEGQRLAYEGRVALRRGPDGDRVERAEGRIRERRGVRHTVRSRGALGAGRITVDHAGELQRRRRGDAGEMAMHRHPAGADRDDAGHSLRRRPRMLKKKLERITWMPSAIALDDTMTMRIVSDDASRAPNAVCSHTASAKSEPATPLATMTAPRASPTSSVTTRNARSRRRSGGRSPSLIAKIFVNAANTIVWKPMTTSIAA